MLTPVASKSSLETCEKRTSPFGRRGFSKSPAARTPVRNLVVRHFLNATCSCLIAAFVSLMVIFLTAAASVQGASPPLKNGDRIVFLGDSITQAGAGPTGFITLVRKALEKNASLDVKVFGAGIGGHKVPDLEARLERDVLSKKPTIVVIYIGINDVWHSLRGRGTSKTDYEQGLRRLVAKINSAGARVILCTPSTIGEKHDLSNPLDNMLEEYSAISRNVASDTKSQMLDLRQDFLAYLKEHNPKTPRRTFSPPMACI